MLTPLEISSYQESGYVLPDYRVSDETVESIRERYERLLLEHPEFRDNCSALLRYDPAFAQYAFEPAILDLVEQLIGPDIALWNMSFFAKPALNGKAVPWHQDGEYWPIRPLATCTVWIALDDSTTENGCLRVISGSHRNRALLAHRNNPNPDFVLHQQLIETEFDEGKAVDITLQKGRISLHDVYLAHGSAPKHLGTPAARHNHAFHAYHLTLRLPACSADACPARWQQLSAKPAALDARQRSAWCQRFHEILKVECSLVRKLACIPTLSER